MRYVLITRDGPEHRYVANRLDRAIGLAAVVVDEGRPRTRIARMRQLWRRYTVPQLSGRLILAGLKRAWRDDVTSIAAVQEILGPESHALTRPELELRVQGINTPEAVQRLESLAPDRILVYGSGIVGEAVLALGSHRAINMHTGISPDYRGASCAFWPLHERDLGRLGATIHELSPEVDGGGIYSVRSAELHEDDGLHEVFARCVLVGTEAFVDVAYDLEEDDRPGTPQEPGVGREYRAAMRGLGTELRVRRALKRGLVRDWCRARVAPHRR